MTRESEADPLRFSDWLTLLGFLEEDEALQFIRGQATEHTAEEEWRQKVRRANRAAAAISDRAVGSPEVLELDARFGDRLRALVNEPTFQEQLVGVKKWRFAMVEAEKLHSVQAQLNLEYLDSLVESAPAPDDLDGAVRYCLPTRQEKRKTTLLTSYNPNTNTISIVTENLDFRIAGKVEGQDPKTGTPFFGFGIGFGLPQLSVAICDGRYYIRNGYHRAYALLKRGHRFLPCLLVNIERIEDIGSWGPGYLPVGVVLSEKGPILADFGTEAAVKTPRRRLRMVISVHAELQGIPI